jgi:hypothetical protein
MTGDQLPGTPDSIAEDNGALVWIHENYIKARSGEKKAIKTVRIISRAARR